MTLGAENLSGTVRVSGFARRVALGNPGGELYVRDAHREGLRPPDDRSARQLALHFFLTALGPDTTVELAVF